VKPSGAIKGLALLDGDVIVYVQTLHCMQWPVPAAEGTVWELHALATTGLGAAWAIPIEFAIPMEYRSHEQPRGANSGSRGLAARPWAFDICVRLGS